MNDFQPYIQIQTDFKKPSNVGVVTMLGMASKKILEIPSNSTTKDVQALIKDHYIKSTGQLHFWGNITGYSWIIFEDMTKTESKIFDTSGNFIKDEAIEFMDADLA